MGFFYLLTVSLSQVFWELVESVTSKSILTTLSFSFWRVFLKSNFFLVLLIYLIAVLQFWYQNYAVLSIIQQVLKVFKYLKFFHFSITLIFNSAAVSLVMWWKICMAITSQIHWNSCLCFMCYVLFSSFCVF